MAIVFPSDSNLQSIELNDFITRVEELKDLSVYELLCASAQLLQQLALNKSYLSNCITTELDLMLQKRHLSMYTPQSIIIANFSEFTLRLNFWSPLEGSARRVEQESRLFSYDRAHDHNFSLLTVGVAGPGYRTRIYQYEVEDIVGYAGESVSLAFQEEITLSEGKAIFYLPRKDIHIQIPPEEGSISLNLLVAKEKITDLPQYFFDLDESKIVTMFESRVGRRASLISTIAKLARSDSIPSLLDIALKHSCESTRAAAYRAIYYIDPDTIEYLQKLAIADSSQLVNIEVNRIS
jgi:hypothetical protein